MRAHYTYLIDQEFDLNIRKLKKEHEIYITKMLENIENCKELDKVYLNLKR